MKMGLYTREFYKFIPRKEEHSMVNIQPSKGETRDNQLTNNNLTYAYIHTYIHTHIRTYILVCLHVCVYMYVYDFAIKTNGIWYLAAYANSFWSSGTDHFCFQALKFS